MFQQNHQTPKKQKKKIEFLSDVYVECKKSYKKLGQKAINTQETILS